MFVIQMVVAAGGRVYTAAGCFSDLSISSLCNFSQASWLGLCSSDVLAVPAVESGESPLCSFNPSRCL